MKHLFSLLLVLACGTCMAQNAYFDALTLQKYAKINAEGKISLAVGNYKSPEQLKGSVAEGALKLQISAAPAGPIKDSLQALAKKLQSTNIAIVQSHRNELFTILKKYYPLLQPTDITLDTQNPFFMVDPSGLQAQSKASFLSLSGAAPAVGGLDVTNIANGLAEFLIERGKAEVDEAFFIQLKKFLESYPEFATLFPNTYTFLSSFNSWEYSNLLSTLQAAFNKDISLLPADIIKLKTIPIPTCQDGKSPKDSCAINKRLTQIQKFFATNEGILLLSACKVASGILQNEKTPEIIKSITTDEFLLSFKVLTKDKTEDITGTANVKNALNLINLVSLSIESNLTGKNYISTDDFEALSTDPILRNLYLGLLYQQVKVNNIQFVIKGTQVKMTDLLTVDHVDGTINYIENILSQAKNLQTAIDQLKADKLAAKPDLSLDYASLTENTLQLLAALNNISIIDANLMVPPGVEKFYSYTNQGLQVTNDIFIKNYNSAVMGFLAMLSELAKSQPNIDPVISDFLTNFLKYASFASNVATAKTPDDVKAAIEAVALPVGSYTVKQKSDFNISVNAFVGYAWDFEKFPPNKLYAHGIYAPIGFSFNFGSARPHGVPVGFFASIIDIGSFVSYNLQNTSTDVLKQEVRLESIFSPSVHFFIQYPGTPFTLAAGWRETPKLFYTSSNNTFTPVKAQSVFNVSLLIDIPMFTLHNTPFATAKPTKAKKQQQGNN